jgi:4-azaleucine resistance transporter AzlC
MAVDTLSASRRRLVADTVGITLSAAGFGLVYGLAARAAGFSLLEAGTMSVLVFGGASQFAAVGYVANGYPWLAIVLLTALINSRHLLYGTVLRPYLADRPWPLRALMAHALNDETFAISIAHFRRIGRADLPGYAIAALAGTVVPWIGATLVGAALGGGIPDPARFGLDVIFPAAMAGLAVGLLTERRDLVAAVSGALIAVGVSLAIDPALGIVAGGLVGPIVAMLGVRGRGDEPPTDLSSAGLP